MMKHPWLSELNVETMDQPSEFDASLIIYKL